MQFGANYHLTLGDPLKKDQPVLLARFGSHHAGPMSRGEYGFAVDAKQAVSRRDPCTLSERAGGDGEHRDSVGGVLQTDGYALSLLERFARFCFGDDPW